MFLPGFPNLFRLSVLPKITIFLRVLILTPLGVFLILGFPLESRCQTPSFPYKAQVIHEGTFVRSGPGQEYYPTDTLKKGQIVEVYRHEPGGWYAIRPPEGSFSWVFSKSLDIGADNLARAKEDQVPVVVGSRLKNLQDVVQVYLKEGEEVELLEEENREPKGGKEILRKIAPPSGEFRWIWGQDVTPVNAVSQAETPSAAMGSDAASGSPPGAASAPTGNSPSGSGPGTNPSSLAPSAASPGAVAIPAGAGGLSLGDFQRQFTQIELELAERVMGEPNGWQLQDLHTRAETLLGQAPDAATRAEARQLLSRIVRFLEVQRQYGQIALAGRSGPAKPNLPSGVTSPAASTASAQPMPPPSTPSAASGIPGAGQIGMNPALVPPNSPGQPSGETDRFDAVGRLSRVVSTKPGAPTYALLNEQGEIVSYITPAPGINLRPLEGKWIGVSGVTGLMLEPRAKHVAVKQVAVVESPTTVLR